MNLFFSFRLYVLIVLVSYSSFLFGQDLVKITKDFDNYIFKANSFKSCHASTITELGNHEIIAAWLAGEFEGSKDVCVWMSILREGKWSIPIIIANGIQNDTLRYACWNPVLFRNYEGKLFLFYKVGPNPREWWGEMKISSDEGITWSGVQKLPEGFFGPIKNKPIQLKSGEILYPSSTESLTGNSWKIHLEISDSTVSMWKKIEINNDTFGLIQPSILEYSEGKLQILCRSRQNVIVETWSDDHGKIWTKPEPTKLPNPNSGIDAVDLQNGYKLLVYNPMISGKEWWLGRSELRLAISKDGKKWEDIFTLEKHETGEYSYPAIIQSQDGIIHITYTDNRKNIKYVRLEITKE